MANVQIREVWNDNLDEEFALIRGIIDDYPHIAMDTDFPGVVHRPLVIPTDLGDYNYATIKANVDALNLIQVGLTFSDENGNLPTCGTGNPCVWQFNFREFNVDMHPFVNASIDMLREHGIDFRRNNEMGIYANQFGRLLMESGVVINHDIHWATFDGGNDFGYLLKLLTGNELPNSRSGFFSLINIYFPNIYDIKHLIKFCGLHNCGLNKLAEILEIESIDSRQAGADSLLTSRVFKALKEVYFNENVEKYAGVVFGLGVKDEIQVGNVICEV